MAKDETAAEQAALEKIWGLAAGGGGLRWRMNFHHSLECGERQSIPSHDTRERITCKIRRLRLLSVEDVPVFARGRALRPGAVASVSTVQTSEGCRCTAAWAGAHRGLASGEERRSHIAPRSLPRMATCGRVATPLAP